MSAETIAILAAILGGAWLLANVSSIGENFGNPLSDFAKAIGTAEGFFVVGSRSNRNNNPGDFILAPPASNYTTKSDGTYAIFDTVQDGWQALEDQLDLIRRGVSSIYNVDMSFEEMGQHWSPDGWENWSLNVATFLKAQTKDRIGDYL